MGQCQILCLCCCWVPPLQPPLLLLHGGAEFSVGSSHHGLPETTTSASAPAPAGHQQQQLTRWCTCLRCYWGRNPAAAASVAEAEAAASAAKWNYRAQSVFKTKLVCLLAKTRCQTVAVAEFCTDCLTRHTSLPWLRRSVSIYERIYARCSRHSKTDRSIDR